MAPDMICAFTRCCDFYGPSSGLTLIGLSGRNKEETWASKLSVPECAIISPSDGEYYGSVAG